MNVHQSLILIFSLGVFTLFSACSQSTADIKQSDMCIVFEYTDYDSLPTARLCAFVESESDARRRSEIEVASQKSGFIWNASDLVRIKNGNHNWTGYTNFVMQKNEPFPSDKYRILIRNADQKEAEQILEFNYDSSFYELKADAAFEKMKSMGAVRKVAVYDENDKLLYYDAQTDKYDSARKIWNIYSNAAYYNVIWQTVDNFAICIMPKQLVAPETDQIETETH